MADRVRVLAGTTKGLFVLTSTDGRQTWEVSGPLCGGWPINHAIGDPATGTLWAAGGGDWHGAGVWRSVDGGATWELSLLSNGQMDDWLYAGAKPAGLYESTDGGARWAAVEGLNNHPSGPSWEPGGAGLVLHTILTDAARPERLWVGISAAGVFASEDGGATWERRNRLSNEAADHAHDHTGACGHEIGYCVHNMVRVEGSDLIYQQNHHGVYRSQYGGRSWEDITAGLPSTFGFPIAMNPHDPAMVWTLPLNGDTKGRYPPDARALVWRSSDGGATWQPFGAGLPERNCFFTVLRQAMATDRHQPTGVYFGTNSGSVFASHDQGETWTEAAQHLPTVLCVETLTRP